MTPKKSDKEIAEILSKPLESSAERSKKPSNTHPVKPEDREATNSGNTLVADNLNVALQEQKRAEEKVKALQPEVKTETKK